MVYKFKNIEHNISIIIPHNCIESMLQELINYYPNEFGGILVGVRNKSQSIVVDFLTPSNFKISKNRFIRDSGNLNEELEKIYDLSVGKLEYLGEWHSHPNGNEKFSTGDKKTMLKIASDTDVGFNFPFLLIFSLNTNGYDYKIYVTIENQLIELKKQYPHEQSS